MSIIKKIYIKIYAFFYRDSDNRAVNKTMHKELIKFNKSCK